MSLQFEKFVNDRNYAVAKLIYVGVIALLLLALYFIFLMVSEARSWGHEQEQYPGTTISVTGEGEAIAVPDVARFNFSVSSIQDTVEAAQEDAAEKINAALDYLEQEGIDESDIKTIAYNTYPRYEYTPCRGDFCVNNQQLVGYEVSQTIEVTVRDTEQAGTLLSGVGSRGITNVSGLTFEIDDPSAVEAEARAMAIKDAKEKAKKLAKDLGVDLDDIVGFSEDEGRYYPEPYMAKNMAFDEMAETQAVAPELPVGENTVTSFVYITYEID